MAMHVTTVRFGDEIWSLLEAEARRQGTSAAQVVRDATVMRLASLAVDRGEPAPAVEALARQARRPGDGPPAAIRDPERLAVLRATGLLDSPPEQRFDRIARIAAKALSAPTALVSLVDGDRQCFKSAIGLAEPWATSRQSPLSHSFCQHAVAAREPLVVWDAREHPLVQHNKAIADMGVIAYAGVPLITSSGAAVGSLCVIDSRPRVWTADQVELLSDLAATVVAEIERTPSGAQSASA